MRRRDLARTAWLQATAYANTATTCTGYPRSHPYTWARLAWPGTLAAHCILGHRNMHLTASRKGVICLYGTPPIGLIVRGAALLVPLAATVLLPYLTLNIIVTLAYAILLGSLTASIALTGRRSRAPRGTTKIAAPCKHYVIGLAAAHPTAPTGEVLLLARGLISRLPPGSVTIVHPRTAELRTAYERFGFQPSNGMAMVYRGG